jgi:hypothetical protein
VVGLLVAPFLAYRSLDARFEVVQAALNDIHRTPDHTARLVAALDKVISGGSGVADAFALEDLQEHTPDNPMWGLRDQLEECWKQMPKAETRLREREEHDIALPNIAGGATTLVEVLRNRVGAIQYDKQSALPGPWEVTEDGRLLLGAFVATVTSWGDVYSIWQGFKTIWDEIPDWPELATVRTLEQQAWSLRMQIHVEIEDLKAHSVLPGRCKHCLPKGSPTP